MSGGRIEVAVLGPLELRGTAEPFRRPAARDLAVYLALHRRPVAHAQWALALWPDRDVAASTVHATASDCRRALGRDGAGRPHLPPGPRLCLTGSVVSDVERFGAEVASGVGHRVLGALGLVRGPFLDGVGRSDWAVLDGTAARVESMVAKAALDAAAELVAGQRGEEAAWAVRQALLLCPYDERLYRMLLRATEAQGNRAGLRAAWDELRILAGELPRRPTPMGAGGADGADGWLHPRTRALYRRLLAGAPGA